MTSNDDTGRPGELTDAQLDHLLGATSEELLAHVHATADPTRTLTAIMNTASSPPPPTRARANRGPESTAATMIRLRARARALDQALDQARDQVRDLALGALGRPTIRTLSPTLSPLTRFRRMEGYPRSLACFLACIALWGAPIAATDFLGPGFLQPAVRALFSHGPIAVMLLVLATSALAAAALVVATDPDRARTRALSHALSHARTLDQALDQARDRACGISHLPGRARATTRNLDSAGVRALARNLDRAAALDRNYALYRSRDRARDQATGIHHALDHISGLASAIRDHPVDASGTDLSHLTITDLQVLDGVIWTPQTTWPPGIAARVGKLSDEILRGVYQVHIGDTPDRTGLTRV
jgi:hypothetical protein